MNTCDLSIVIVNWNTRQLLMQCLESVNGDRLSVIGNPPPNTEYRLPFTETLVVDNASSDGSAATVRERFPGVHLIENGRNTGFALANNQGICHSRGRYVMLLNSDTVVHPGALQTMIDFMDAHPEVGACGPRLLNGDGSLQPSVHPMLTPGREFWRLSFLEQLSPRATYPVDRWDTVTPRPVEVIKGACLVLRRAALDQIGLLDDRYFMYTEEVDLCYRLAQDGWQLWYVPLAVVTHFGEASSRQVREEMYIQLYRSKLQFFRKFGGEGHARQAQVLLALAYSPRAAIASLRALIDPAWRPRAHTYRRLLAELPGM
ncbi:MAG: glycosyltransferase family 2 protein [Anaerolineae bacterium]|nr:glycosyltransferase family 2 protein [Anaerolineae bacterium]MCB0254137.1 glycosyltransferase family 2 protein [Anaerolineae bacterium]